MAKKVRFFMPKKCTFLDAQKSTFALKKEHFLAMKKYTLRCFFQTISCIDHDRDLS